MRQLGPHSPTVRSAGEPVAAVLGAPRSAPRSRVQLAGRRPSGPSGLPGRDPVGGFQAVPAGTAWAGSSRRHLSPCLSHKGQLAQGHGLLLAGATGAQSSEAAAIEKDR